MDVSVDTDSIVWSSAEYKLKFILDNPNFGLPQIVKVIQGYMHDEDDSLASGQILTLHGRKMIEKYHGVDERGKEVNIPVNCPYKVKLLSHSKKRYFKGVKDICKCEERPEAIVCSDELSTGDGKSLPVGTRLHILDTLKDEDENTIGIVCEVAWAGERFNLPIDFVSSFEEALPLEALNKRYTIAEVVKDFSLPLEVQFLPVTERNSGYGPQLGSLHLAKSVSSDVIMATSVLDEVRYAITFTADLPVTIQVAQGMLDNHVTYEETRRKQQENIDLSRFDTITAADPYAPILLKNEVYDEIIPEPPEIPQLPPRARSATPSGLMQPPPRVANPPPPSPQVPPRHYPKPNLRPTKQDTSLSSRIPDIKELESFLREKLKFKKSFRSKSKKDKSESVQSDPDMTPQNKPKIDDKYRDNQQDSCSDTCSIGGAASLIFESSMSTSGQGDSSSSSSDPYCSVVDFMPPVCPPSTATIRSRNSSKSSDSGFSSLVKRNTHRSNQYPDQDDALSEWSLPTKLSDSRKPESRKNSEPAPITRSASILWGHREEKNRKPVYPKRKHNDQLRKMIIPETLTDDNTSTYSAGETFSDVSLSDTSSQNETDLQKQKSILEIRSLNEEGVAKILSLLKMSEHIESFRENQINGELLITLDVTDFISELKLSIFQAKKLSKYIQGWRPGVKDMSMDSPSRRDSLNPRHWSEDDVSVHLKSINLPDFACFCKHNQIDGKLLLDIIDNDTLQSLAIEHHIKISNLEAKKLVNFVVKGWRPDSAEKQEYMH